MDVTRLISELRSEREGINQEILSLERVDRLSTEAAEVTAQSVTYINRHSLAAVRGCFIEKV